MLDSLKEFLPEDATLLFILSRGFIALAWTYTLKSIWKHRTLPGANQALAGALALIIIQALLIFDFNIPSDTLHAFLSTAHLVIAVSYTKLLTYAGHGRGARRAKTSFLGLSLALDGDPVRSFYTRMMVTLSLLGVIGLSIQVWLGG